MKTAIYLLSFMFLFQFSLMAQDGRDWKDGKTEKVITMQELPQKAQDMIKTHFSKSEVKKVKQETGKMGMKYEVEFLDLTDVEFDQNGDWTSIDTENVAIPVMLIPEKIYTYVKSNYPNNFVTELKQNRKGYKVELNNDTKLWFNSDCEFVPMKDKKMK